MKKLILSAVTGIVLCATSLSLTDCSKDDKLTQKPDPPRGFGDIDVFLYIDNQSSKYKDDQVNIHFNYQYSRCDGREYHDGDAYSFSNWHLAHIDYLIALNKVTNFKEKSDEYGPMYNMGANFHFEGSTVTHWHQRITLSIGNDNQQDLQIEGPSTVNSPSDISISKSWTRGGERQIEFKVDMVYVGKVSSRHPNPYNLTEGIGSSDRVEANGVYIHVIVKDV